MSHSKLKPDLNLELLPLLTVSEHADLLSDFAIKSLQQIKPCEAEQNANKTFEGFLFSQPEQDKCPDCGCSIQTNESCTNCADYASFIQQDYVQYRH